MTFWALMFTLLLVAIGVVCVAIIVKGTIDDRRMLRAWREHHIGMYGRSGL